MWLSGAPRDQRGAQLQQRAHLSYSGPHNTWIADGKSGDPRALTAAGAEVSAGRVTAHNTRAHTLGYVCTIRRQREIEREGGGGQCVAASAAHEYSGCKLLQLFLSSIRGKLLSPTLLPPHPSLFL